MKKLFLSFLLFLLVLTGCWDQTELNEITIVTGMAVDKGKDHKYLLTIEQLNAPSLDPTIRGAQTASIIFSQEGDSIGELVRKMNIASTRKLVYSHMRTVIFSKEIAEQGLLEFIDFMESDREIRNDFNFVLVNDHLARDVLKITYPIQRIATFKVNRQLQTMIEEWGGDPDVRLRDFIHALTSPGREPVVAEIKINGDPEQGNEIKNMEKVEQDAIVVLDALSIFKGMKYQGSLPIKHTRNYLILQDQLNLSSITVSCDAKSKTTARINNSKTNIKAFYKNDVPHFNIEVELEGRLEVTQCPDDFSKNNVYLKYEKMLAGGLKKEIAETIKILQEEYEADIFGFGEHMERQDYDRFKKVKDNWNEEFAKAEFNLDVKLKLRRAGLKTTPFLLDLDQ